MIAYQRRTSLDTPLGRNLAGLAEYCGRTKALLTALGDYWTAYYRDLETLATAATGSVVAVSAEYARLLDFVLASNVLDVPIRTPTPAELLLFDEADLEAAFDDAGNLDHYEARAPGLADFSYLTTSLFESEVVLEQGRHFDFGPDGELRLYVDIFRDPGIVPYAYRVSGAARPKMLLWATDVSLNSSLIYERFGRFLYRRAKDSEQYKWLVTALLHFYTNPKSVRKIEDVLNILYGVPYARYDGEIVTAIRHVDEALRPLPSSAEAAFIAIETDRSTYYTYEFSDLRVSVGQRLAQFQLLSAMHTVDDYRTDPGWWERAGFPDHLLADDSAALTAEQKRELLGKVLKYNLISITLRVSHPTWATYVSQIREIRTIIDSGLPCYLTTLLNTVFRAAFADAADGADEFRVLSARLGFVCRHLWGGPLRYDGGVSYDMRAVPDHGSAARDLTAAYDGAVPYDHSARHLPAHPGAASYDGDEHYASAWSVCHGGERDQLRLLTAGLRTEDAYPWERSGAAFRPCQPVYDGTAVAAGALRFGLCDQALPDFEARLRLAGMTDAAPSPVERTGLVLHPAAPADVFGPARFCGGLHYDGQFPPGDGPVDSFALTLRRA